MSAVLGDTRRENRKLRAEVRKLSEALAAKDELLANCQPDAVADLKLALLRTHQDREAAYQRVARLEKLLDATQKQLDDAMGYSTGDRWTIAAHSHPFEIAT